MINGEESVSVSTSQAAESVWAAVQEGLQAFGEVSISERGEITIDPQAEYLSPFYKTIFDGELTHNAQEWTATVGYR